MLDHWRTIRYFGGADPELEPVCERRMHEFADWAAALRQEVSVVSMLVVVNVAAGIWNDWLVRSYC